MRKALVRLAFLSCLVVGPASAGPPHSLERAFETSTSVTTIPATLPTVMDARGCTQCPSTRLEVPSTARFFVGKEEVSLTDLRRHALGKHYNMVIFYELDSNVVRRIVVAGSLATADVSR